MYRIQEWVEKCDRNNRRPPSSFWNRPGGEMFWLGTSQQRKWQINLQFRDRFYFFNQPIVFKSRYTFHSPTINISQKARANELSSGMRLSSTSYGNKIFSLTKISKRVLILYSWSFAIKIIGIHFWVKDQRTMALLGHCCEKPSNTRASPRPWWGTDAAVTQE